MDGLDLNFLELQVGSGGWAKLSPPPILTPTWLQTAIKATNHDSGLISKKHLAYPPAMIHSSHHLIFDALQNCFKMQKMSHFSIMVWEAPQRVILTVPTCLGSCNSPTPPRLLPLDYEKRGFLDPSNTTGTDPDTSSCNSPTLKGKLLGHEQRGLKEYGYAGIDTGSHNSPTPKDKPHGNEQRGSVEHGDDMHVCLDTGSGEVSLSSGTAQASSVVGGSLAPAWSTTNTTDTLHEPWCNSPVAAPQDLDLGDNNINLDEMLNKCTFTVGRPLEAVLDMIQEGLDHINVYLTDLATHSGQPPQQIIDCFLKQYA
ncbi:hypothetical protein EDC04DRAFT_2900037 [Pisolithus marmoratus]|nr:hypothetical protein EDC04DRAFT_2900037 [Pisolithus marmoratus]